MNFIIAIAIAYFAVYYFGKMDAGNFAIGIIILLAVVFVLPVILNKVKDRFSTIVRYLLCAAIIINASLISFIYVFQVLFGFPHGLSIFSTIIILIMTTLYVRNIPVETHSS